MNTQAKTLYEQDLVDACINLCNDCDKRPVSAFVAVQTAKSIFLSEYAWRVEQIGPFKAMAEWLEGGSLSINAWRDDVEELLRVRGILKADDKSARVHKIVGAHFEYHAHLLNMLFDKKEAYFKKFNLEAL